MQILDVRITDSYCYQMYCQLVSVVVVNIPQPTGGLLPWTERMDLIYLRNVDGRKVQA
jgi:hypothetical protein